MKCRFCGKGANIGLKRHRIALCEQCYPKFFRKQVLHAVEKEKMFTKEEKICVAVSGGKDSMALLHVLHVLGYNVEAFHIDLGIDEYSRKCREIVERFCKSNRIGYHILKLKQERGKSLKDVLVKTKRPPCSVCGIVKRYLTNKFARENKYDVVATGHNMDDELVFLFSNLLRGDVSALIKQGPVLETSKLMVKRVKPLYKLTDLEVKYYVEIKSVEHQREECPYSKGAKTLLYKEWWNMLEDGAPGIKANFYLGFLRKIQPVLSAGRKIEKETNPSRCRICGEPTSTDVCSMCKLLR